MSCALRSSLDRNVWHFGRNGPNGPDVRASLWESPDGPDSPDHPIERFTVFFLDRKPIAPGVERHVILRN